MSVVAPSFVRSDVTNIDYFLDRLEWNNYFSYRTKDWFGNPNPIHPRGAKSAIVRPQIHHGAIQQWSKTPLVLFENWDFEMFAIVFHKIIDLYISKKHPHLKKSECKKWYPSKKSVMHLWNWIAHNFSTERKFLTRQRIVVLDTSASSSGNLDTTIGNLEIYFRGSSAEFTFEYSNRFEQEEYEQELRLRKKALLEEGKRLKSQISIHEEGSPSHLEALKTWHKFAFVNIKISRALDEV